MSSDFLKTDVGRSVLSRLLSLEDDLGDVSVFDQHATDAAETNYTLLNVSDGPKTVLGIFALGDRFMNQNRNTFRVGPVNVDGTSNTSYPPSGYYRGETGGGYKYGAILSFPIRYDVSLTVKWRHGGTGNEEMTAVAILGSEDKSVAVVKDGEPVYMQAGPHLSGDTIESMEVPKGFKKVVNPEIDHENPQTRGMWDDDRKEVVDHPYLKPFHEKLDELRALSRHHGRETVHRKVKGSSKLPGDVKPDWPLPEDHDSRDPELDAVEWWMKNLEEERRQLPGLEEVI